MHERKKRCNNDVVQENDDLIGIGQRASQPASQPSSKGEWYEMMNAAGGMWGRRGIR